MKRVGLLVALAGVLLGGTARAQDGGATALAAADFFIGVQHQQGANLRDFELQRFFNKANCDCAEPIFLFFALQSSGLAKRSFVTGTGNVEFWVGNSCEQVLLQGGCDSLGTETISAFLGHANETRPSDAATMSRYTATTSVADGGTTGDAVGPCTAPVEQFSRSVYLLVDYNGDKTYEVISTLSVPIDLTPPPAAKPVEVAQGNEALVVSWTGIDSSIYTDLLGYQVMCRRAADLQVFPNGTFSAGFQTCGATGMAGLEGLDPAFACSPLLSRLTTSFRVKILQNGITYAVTLLSIDNSGNARASSPLVFGVPTKTSSFYDVYRDSFQGGSGGSADAGDASGGFCGIAASDAPSSRGKVALSLVVALTAFASVARRRGRGRRR